MTLREYISQYQRSVKVSVRKSIADELEVRYRTLRAYEFRERPMNPQLLPKLEEITNGVVTAQEMRPDIFVDRKSLKRMIRKAKLKIIALETSQAH